MVQYINKCDKERHMEQYVLQSRWKLEGRSLYYYGLRNKEDMFRNRVRLSSKQLAIIKSLPYELDDDKIKALGNLVGEQIVMQSELRRIPRSLLEARYCTECCANDFIIPGLEFDADGRCPMCQTADDVKELRSVVPIVKEIPRAKHSRFDIALFYTGGKDSTYLLYYLAVVKKLRVLALTWEIPFISDCARQSIQNAKARFDNVEFITRSLAKNDLDKIYRRLYELSGNTCACPSLAYLIFYPELVANKVPYFIAGNEPVQMLGLYYNHMAPRIAYTFPESRILPALINIGRVITLRPPLKKGQIHTLLTMRQLAFGDNPFKKLSGYSNELVSDVVTAIHEVPELLPPFKKSIRRSSRTGNIPAFIHLDLDEISGGVYDWRSVKEIIIKECGWVEPDDAKKGLHTSCKIEKCKDHSQFTRFYHCKSRMIPFSALEISLTSRKKGQSKEDIVYEMEKLMGFSLDEIPECAIMRGEIKKI